MRWAQYLVRRARCSLWASQQLGRGCLRPGVQPYCSTLCRRLTGENNNDTRSEEDAEPSPLYKVQRWGDQRTLVATAPVDSGTEVYRVPRLPEFILRHPGTHSVQVSSEEHLNFASALPAASLTHHECEPNGDLIVTADAVVFVARRDIATGEFLSFDYNTTEYFMATPFECRCGSGVCVGTVGGFKLLSPEHRAKILPRCSWAVLELASQEGLCNLPPR